MSLLKRPSVWPACTHNPVETRINEAGFKDDSQIFQNLPDTMKIRIVKLDFYMGSPIPGLDVLYSEFRGSSVHHVPIIRVYGSTEEGKKICLHVHGVFPYIYIPYDAQVPAEGFLYQVASALDKAINLSLGQASSNAQHVYRVCLVSGFPFYGYHARKHQFLKIYFYNPLLIKKASALLQNGTILGKIYQPHEAHIPYILQFMIDYNLHGMSFVHLSDLKYRVDKHNGDNHPENSILPPSVAKMSTCRIEGDTHADHILNLRDVVPGKLTVNPGIKALWDDERQRRADNGESSPLGRHLTQNRGVEVPQTVTHLAFKSVLDERLKSKPPCDETGTPESNLSVYPAETPPSSDITDASVVDKHHLPGSQSSTDNSSLFEETIVEDDANLDETVLDEDALKMCELLMEMRKDNVDGDSILSQEVRKEDESEEEGDGDLSLPLNATLTPKKIRDAETWEDFRFDSSEKIPQLDGVPDETSGDEEDDDGTIGSLSPCVCDDDIDKMNTSRFEVESSSKGILESPSILQVDGSIEGLPENKPKIKTGTIEGKDPDIGAIFRCVDIFRKSGKNPVPQPPPSPNRNRRGSLPNHLGTKRRSAKRTFKVKTATLLPKSKAAGSTSCPYCIAGKHFLSPCIDCYFLKSIAPTTTTPNLPDDNAIKEETKTNEELKQTEIEAEIDWVIRRIFFDLDRKEGKMTLKKRNAIEGNDENEATMVECVVPASDQRKKDKYQNPPMFPKSSKKKKKINGRKKGGRLLKGQTILSFGTSSSSGGSFGQSLTNDVKKSKESRTGNQKISPSNPLPIKTNIFERFETLSVLPTEIAQDIASNSIIQSDQPLVDVSNYDVSSRSVASNVNQSEQSSVKVEEVGRSKATNHEKETGKSQVTSHSISIRSVASNENQSEQSSVKVEEVGRSKATNNEKETGRSEVTNHSIRSVASNLNQSEQLSSYVEEVGTNKTTNRNANTSNLSPRREGIKGANGVTSVVSSSKFKIKKRKQEVPKKFASVVKSVRLDQLICKDTSSLPTFEGKIKKKRGRKPRRDRIDTSKPKTGLPICESEKCLDSGPIDNNKEDDNNNVNVKNRNFDRTPGEVVRSKATNHEKERGTPNVTSHSISIRSVPSNVNESEQSCVNIEEVGRSKATNYEKGPVKSKVTSHSISMRSVASNVNQSEQFSVKVEEVGRSKATSHEKGTGKSEVTNHSISIRSVASNENQSEQFSVKVEEVGKSKATNQEKGTGEFEVANHSISIRSVPSNVNQSEQSLVNVEEVGGSKATSHEKGTGKSVVTSRDVSTLSVASNPNQSYQLSSRIEDVGTIKTINRVTSIVSSPKFKNKKRKHEVTKKCASVVPTEIVESVRLDQLISEDTSSSPTFAGKIKKKRGRKPRRDRIDTSKPKTGIPTCQSEKCLDMPSLFSADSAPVGDNKEDDNNNVNVENRNFDRTLGESQKSQSSQTMCENGEEVSDKEDDLSAEIAKISGANRNESWNVTSRQATPSRLSIRYSTPNGRYNLRTRVVFAKIDEPSPPKKTKAKRTKVMRRSVSTQTQKRKSGRVGKNRRDSKVIVVDRQLGLNLHLNWDLGPNPKPKFNVISKIDRSRLPNASRFPNTTWSSNVTEDECVSSRAGESSNAVTVISNVVLDGSQSFDISGIEKDKSVKAIRSSCEREPQIEANELKPETSLSSYQIPGVLVSESKPETSVAYDEIGAVPEPKPETSLSSDAIRGVLVSESKPETPLWLSEIEAMQVCESKPETPLWFREIEAAQVSELKPETVLSSDTIQAVQAFEANEPEPSLSDEIRGLSMFESNAPEPEKSLSNEIRGRSMFESNAPELDTSLTNEIGGLSMSGPNTPEPKTTLSDEIRDLSMFESNVLDLETPTLNELYDEIAGYLFDSQHSEDFPEQTDGACPSKNRKRSNRPGTNNRREIAKSNDKLMEKIRKSLKQLLDSTKTITEGRSISNRLILESLRTNDNCRIRKSPKKIEKEEEGRNGNKGKPVRPIKLAKTGEEKSFLSDHFEIQHTVPDSSLKPTETRSSSSSFVLTRPCLKSANPTSVTPLFVDSSSKNNANFDECISKIGANSPASLTKTPTTIAENSSRPSNLRKSNRDISSNGISPATPSDTNPPFTSETTPKSGRIASKNGVSWSDVNPPSTSVTTPNASEIASKNGVSWSDVNPSSTSVTTPKTSEIALQNGVIWTDVNLPSTSVTTPNASEIASKNGVSWSDVNPSSMSVTTPKTSEIASQNGVIWTDVNPSSTSVTTPKTSEIASKNGVSWSDVNPPSTSLTTPKTSEIASQNDVIWTDVNPPSTSGTTPNASEIASKNGVIWSDVNLPLMPITTRKACGNASTGNSNLGNSNEQHSQNLANSPFPPAAVTSQTRKANNCSDRYSNESVFPNGVSLPFSLVETPKINRSISKDGVNLNRMNPPLASITTPNTCDNALTGNANKYSSRNGINRRSSLVVTPNDCSIKNQSYLPTLRNSMEDVSKNGVSLPFSQTATRKIPRNAPRNDVSSRGMVLPSTIITPEFNSANSKLRNAGESPPGNGIKQRFLSVVTPDGHTIKNKRCLPSSRNSREDVSKNGVSLPVSQTVTIKIHKNTSENNASSRRMDLSSTMITPESNSLNSNLRNSNEHGSGYKANASLSPMTAPTKTKDLGRTSQSWPSSMEISAVAVSEEIISPPFSTDSWDDTGFVDGTSEGESRNIDSRNIKDGVSVAPALLRPLSTAVGGINLSSASIKSMTPRIIVSISWQKLLPVKGVANTLLALLRPSLVVRDETKLVEGIKCPLKAGGATAKNFENIRGGTGTSSPSLRSPSVVGDHMNLMEGTSFPSFPIKSSKSQANTSENFAAVGNRRSSTPCLWSRPSTVVDETNFVEGIRQRFASTPAPRKAILENGVDSKNMTKRGKFSNFDCAPSNTSALFRTSSSPISRTVSKACPAISKKSKTLESSDPTVVRSPMKISAPFGTGGVTTHPDASKKFEISELPGFPMENNALFGTSLSSNSGLVPETPPTRFKKYILNKGTKDITAAEILELSGSPREDGALSSPDSKLVAETRLIPLKTFKSNKNKDKMAAKILKPSSTVESNALYGTSLSPNSELVPETRLIPSKKFKSNKGKDKMGANILESSSVPKESGAPFGASSSPTSKHDSTPKFRTKKDEMVVSQRGTQDNSANVLNTIRSSTNQHISLRNRGIAEDRQPLPDENHKNKRQHPITPINGDKKLKTAPSLGEIGTVSCNFESSHCEAHDGRTNTPNSTRSSTNQNASLRNKGISQARQPSSNKNPKNKRQHPITPNNDAKKLKTAPSLGETRTVSCNFESSRCEANGRRTNIPDSIRSSTNQNASLRNKGIAEDRQPSSNKNQRQHRITPLNGDKKLKTTPSLGENVTVSCNFVPSSSPSNLRVLTKPVGFDLNKTQRRKKSLDGDGIRGNLRSSSGTCGNLNPERYAKLTNRTESIRKNSVASESDLLPTNQINTFDTPLLTAFRPVNHLKDVDERLVRYGLCRVFAENRHLLLTDHSSPSSAANSIVRLQKCHFRNPFASNHIVPVDSVRATAITHASDLTNYVPGPAGEMGGADVASESSTGKRAAKRKIRRRTTSKRFENGPEDVADYPVNQYRYLDGPNDSSGDDDDEARKPTPKSPRRQNKRKREASKYSPLRVSYGSPTKSNLQAPLNRSSIPLANQDPRIPPRHKRKLTFCHSSSLNPTEIDEKLVCNCKSAKDGAVARKEYVTIEAPPAAGKGYPQTGEAGIVFDEELVETTSTEIVDPLATHRTGQNVKDSVISSSTTSPNERNARVKKEALEESSVPPIINAHGKRKSLEDSVMIQIPPTYNIGNVHVKRKSLKGSVVVEVPPKAPPTRNIKNTYVRTDLKDSVMMGTPPIAPSTVDTGNTHLKRKNRKDSVYVEDPPTVPPTCNIENAYVRRKSLEDSVNIEAPPRSPPICKIDNTCDNSTNRKDSVNVEAPPPAPPTCHIGNAHGKEFNPIKSPAVDLLAVNKGNAHVENLRDSVINPIDPSIDSKTTASPTSNKRNTSFKPGIILNSNDSKMVASSRSEAERKDPTTDSEPNTQFELWDSVTTPHQNIGKRIPETDCKLEIHRNLPPNERDDSRFEMGFSLITPAQKTPRNVPRKTPPSDENQRRGEEAREDTPTRNSPVEFGSTLITPYQKPGRLNAEDVTSPITPYQKRPKRRRSQIETKAAPVIKEGGAREDSARTPDFTRIDSSDSSASLSDDIFSPNTPNRSSSEIFTQEIDVGNAAQMYDVRMNFVPRAGTSKLTPVSRSSDEIPTPEQLSLESNVPEHDGANSEIDLKISGSDKSSLREITPYQKNLKAGTGKDPIECSQGENRIGSGQIEPRIGSSESEVTPYQKQVGGVNEGGVKSKLAAHLDVFEYVPGNDDLTPGSEAIVPKFKPPSRAHVESTLPEYNIPKMRHRQPFYGDVKDVTGPMEIGVRILKIPSDKMADLPEFEGNFRGIDRYRRKILEVMYPGEKMSNKDVINLKMTFCKNEYRLVTPAHLPPTRKEVELWLRSESGKGERKEDRRAEKTKKIFIPRSPGREGEESDDSLTISPCTPMEETLKGVEDGLGDETLRPSQSLKSRSREDDDPVKISIGSDESFSNLAPKQKRNDSGQITGVTLDRTNNFAISRHNLQEAKAVREYLHLTVMCMELIVETRGDYKPNPAHDVIKGIVYRIFNDFPEDGAVKRSVRGCFLLDNLSSSPSKVNFSVIDGVVIDEGDMVKVGKSEEDLVKAFLDFFIESDPDILVGYEVEMLSWGYLVERGYVLNLNLIGSLSRLINNPGSKNKSEDDEGDLTIPGRIVLDFWRLLRHEIALQSYTFENIAYHVLHERVPTYSFRNLTYWWNHPSGLYRSKVLDFYYYRVAAVLRIMDQLDLIGRTSEMAKLYGIQFFEVLSRGSQFRVESMMLRLAKPLNYIPVSPGVQQRAKMKAPEFLPLIMEPESKFYADPVIVLDFQSLYPSMIIAYNLCFSTCLGRIEHLGRNAPFEFGAAQLKLPRKYVKILHRKDLINATPCGVAFVKKSVRHGILPKMLEEILDTRLMVKKSLKRNAGNRILERVLDARQLGLKLIANVTYGYTAANFSARMPCVEVADSVVSKGRETLQRAINLVEKTPRWGARVVYGDTDSMFVLVAGKSREEAFEIGAEIAEAVTDANPSPVKLKLEKVFHPCILQTKKRYVGYMYESPQQKDPKYCAKGIETVRRDGCPAVSKMLEKCLKLLFDTRNVSLVRQYVVRQFSKILSGRISIQELTFAKEYRGSSGYRPGACVPALELARKWLAVDKRSEPRRSERVPYVIVNGPPGLPLIRLVRSPRELIADPSLRPNALYYVTKVIIPPINRCFLLIGADLNNWFNDMPRKQIQYLHASSPTEGKKSTISQYFSTRNCVVCARQSKEGVCDECVSKPQATGVVLHEKVRLLEKNCFEVRTICESCCSTSDKISCVSLDCPVYYKRVQTEREVQQAPFVRELIGLLPHLEF